MQYNYNQIQTDLVEKDNTFFNERAYTIRHKLCCFKNRHYDQNNEINMSLGSVVLTVN
jgi:hypothetical protein